MLEAPPLVSDGESPGTPQQQSPETGLRHLSSRQGPSREPPTPNPTPREPRPRGTWPRHLQVGQEPVLPLSPAHSVLSTWPPSPQWPGCLPLPQEIPVALFQDLCTLRVLCLTLFFFPRGLHGTDENIGSER